MEPTCAFYSFWFQSSSKQNPSFEMYVCGVLFLFIYRFCLRVDLECISKSEGISAYNRTIDPNSEFHVLHTINRLFLSVDSVHETLCNGLT